MHDVLFLVYTVLMVLISIFNVFYIHLIYYALVKHYRSAKRTAQPTPALTQWPSVTIQLPLFNEMHVVDALIDTVASLNYPSEQLEIQVLDDSTDATTERAARKVQHWQDKGIAIHHIRRAHRTGYKAGALAEGLNQAKGKYVAIFDADFRPPPDFLQRTIPHFSDEHVGLVQTRWEHINPSYSYLTRLQAFALDGQFIMEKVGRKAGDLFMKFNGTAGVWRKCCIEEAGGWASDTLTEDLDLSFRAQLKDWRVIYVPDVTTPAELPVTMDAFKAQQFRWVKGQAETIVKLTRPLLRAALPLRVKAHALVQLFYSNLNVLLFLSLLISLPMLAVLYEAPNYAVYFKYLSFTIINTITFAVLYFAALVVRHGSLVRSVFHFVYIFPVMLTIYMGISLQNTVALLEGYRGKHSAFVRTPKFNIVTKQDSWKTKAYTLTTIPKRAYFELALGIIFLLASAFSIRVGIYEILPFHLMASLGFFVVAGYSIRHAS